MLGTCFGIPLSQLSNPATIYLSVNYFQKLLKGKVYGDIIKSRVKDTYGVEKGKDYDAEMAIMMATRNMSSGQLSILLQLANK